MGAGRLRTAARGAAALTLCGMAVLAIDGVRGEARAETRTLPFKQLHTGETVTITFKRNGRYDQEGLKQINYILRDWRRNESTTMDPKLLDLVWEVRKEVGSSAPVYVLSGYRSPVTNAMLRSRSSGVAKYSQHMLGKALDFYLPDIPLAKLRETALRYQGGGVGYYPTSGSPFVHMDTGSVRHWPRMTRQQLAKVFPDGKTVHIPSDGKPMSGYDRAVAELKRGAPSSGSSSGSSRTQVAINTGRGDPSRVVYASAAPSSRSTSASSSSGSGRNFVAALFNRRDEEQDDADSADTPTPVVEVAPTVVAKLEPLKDAPVPRLKPGAESIPAAIPETTISVAEAPIPAPKPILVASLVADDGADDGPGPEMAAAPIPVDKPLLTASVMPPSDLPTRTAAALPRARPLLSGNDAIGMLIADGETATGSTPSPAEAAEPMTATALASTGPVADLPPFAATFTGPVVPLRDGPALVAIDYRPEALEPYMDSDNCLRGEHFVVLRHPDQADIGALTSISGLVVENTFTSGPQLIYPMRKFTGPAVMPVATRSYEVALNDDTLTTGSIRRASLTPSRDLH